METLPDNGKPANRLGIIDHDGSTSVRLRSSPTTAARNVIEPLPFNTHVQVIERLAGDWSLISVPSGELGYVASMHLRTGLPEPAARLHRVEGGNHGTALAIAQTYYGDIADDWGQDLRYYVNVLGHVNHLLLPERCDGWQTISFQAGRLIWIPSHDFARGLHGTLPSGSYSYQVMDRLGLAKAAKRATQLWDDFCIAVALSEKYLAGALERQVDVEQVLYETLLALGMMILAGGVLLAGATAIGTIVGGPAGAAAGFHMGLVLLEWLGLGMMVAWLASTLSELGKAFG